MAGLFLIATGDPGYAEPALTEACDQFGRHGFRDGTRIDLPGWTLLHWPFIAGGPDSLYREGDDLVAIAGSFVFDGKMGRPALAALLASAELPALDWSRIGGQFAAFVRKGGRSFVFTDFFAAFQLFHDTRLRSFSTSLLAAAKAQPRLTFDAQGVYELAFNVTPIGDDTVFEELKTLGPGQVIELTATGARAHDNPKPLPAAATDQPIDERIARHRDRLEGIVGAHVRSFGDRVNAPLSGGIDSRLLLAALRAAGCTPSLYVYGSPTGEDVRIAQAIGKAEGFEVEWIDKENHDFRIEDFPAQVERDFHQFDALPAYGNIFDDGGNAAAFDRRHAGGALAASGGCGEIYRDFFFLPDRPMAARRVASTFFARFVSSDATERFDPDVFLDRIAAKIGETLEPPAPGKRIPRVHLEQIYPRVRCRALFGREISIEARFGAYLMPFLDHQVVAEAMTLPIRLKQAGRFEAMLLHAIDPVLARHMSAYGHDFAGPPSLKHRLSELSTRVRPAWLRERSYALHRRRGRVGDEHGGYGSPDYLGRVLDLDYPAMRHFFHMDRVEDSGMRRRIAGMEYLARHLGSRVVG